MAITWTYEATEYPDTIQPWTDLGSDRILSIGGSSALIAEYDSGGGSLSFIYPIDNLPWSGSGSYLSHSGISLLGDGRVLLSGGNDYLTSSGVADTWLISYSSIDEELTWVASTDLPVTLSSLVQVTLNDGRLFVLGTNSDFTGVAYLGTVSGDTISWVTSTGTALGSSSLTSDQKATVLSDGRVLVAFGAYEMAFATISGNAVSWASASASGGTYNANAGAPAVAALWPDAVLIGGGWDQIGSYTFPEEYMNTVAHCAISGTTVTLTDFDPLLTSYHPETVQFFRFSDDAILSVCYDIDFGQTDFALGADSAPPPSVVTLSFSAAIDTGSTPYLPVEAVTNFQAFFSSGSVVEAFYPDRAPTIETGSTFDARAPIPFSAAFTSGSVFDGRAAAIIPLAAYFLTGTIVRGKASFEKMLAAHLKTGSLVVPRMGANVGLPGLSIATGSTLLARSKAFAQSAVTIATGSAVSAPGAAAISGEVLIATGSVLAGQAASGSLFNAAIDTGSILDAVGDYTTVTLQPRIDTDLAFAVFTSQPALHIEELA